MKAPSSLSGKQALMPNPTFLERELHGPSDRSGPDHGGDLAGDSQADTWLVRPSAGSRPHRQLDPEEAATPSAEPDESLVADPRAGLTPSQLVDQRLLTLLGSGNLGLYLQAFGRPEGIRRLPGR